VDVQAGPAQDMDQLKEAVSSAAAGTGEVQRVIKESTFQPRAAAFTSLIQQCARARAWQKAVDVFQALQETPGLKVCHVISHEERLRHAQLSRNVHGQGGLQWARPAHDVPFFLSILLPKVSGTEG